MFHGCKNRFGGCFTAIAAPSLLQFWLNNHKAKPLNCSQEFTSTNGDRYIAAKFMGLHRKGLVKDGEWQLVTMQPPFTLKLIWSNIKYHLNIIRPFVTVKVWNARDTEKREGLSKKDFFHKYGFVLMNRKTAMTAADWDDCAPTTLDISHFTGFGMPECETALTRVYSKEVEEIVRELMPDCVGIECDPLCARRGPGTKNPNYSFAPHNDYGFTADDWPLADFKFREQFHQDNVRGFMAVNFWRPVLPMKGPVKKNPLSVCDPKTVKPEDIIPICIRWDHFGFVKMMVIAFDEEQKWYYYPDMTVDEVLVFKSFQYFKSQAGKKLNSCFHTAFEDPTVPPDAEERQSAEYRVRIWF